MRSKLGENISKKFTAKVAKHKSGLDGEYGRVTSKEFAEFVGEEVEITVKRKKEKAQSSEPEEK